ELAYARLHLQLVHVVLETGGIRRGLRPQGALWPAAGTAADPHPPVPLVGEPDVRIDPVRGVGDHLELPVVDRAEIGGHDLAPRGAYLEAEVEVVAVELAEPLVEPDVS